jgi:hypothetical protein
MGACEQAVILGRASCHASEAEHDVEKNRAGRETAQGACKLGQSHNAEFICVDILGFYYKTCMTAGVVPLYQYREKPA